MKRTAYFLKALLAVLLLVQGETLAATCSVSCHMAEAGKMTCGMNAMSQHSRASASGQSGASLGRVSCCRLELRTQLPAVGVAKVKLAKSVFEGFVAFLPWFDHSSEAVLESLHECRAGPPDSGQNPALLPVPPQNAPPILV